uniref:Uncharacterized protein n=1 Tax=Candidatus Kentrum eta TaxID=2126337 RepID=A0A450VAJ1_9GAMM|nr:MAG: hypothetical protein BECKH772A_GA0070896_102412 [Candidatus Kentron sp. H]VFK02030.1 MAG: hypothetical protein BECKH772B_GA0070898_102572 [Candidatus Kentron sp. H]VFK05119.1 MAG: hypothetical protein BECKH772C_GA0070978_102382 [Candidatus Kentron sp. H]
MTKKQEIQTIIRYYRERTGKTEYDMRDVAKFAIENGYQLPKPKSQIDLLTEQFSKAAREETRKDPKTGRPYRANLAVTTWQGGEQMTLWGDIDEAPRPFAKKAFVQRREQMVGDAFQLTLDLTHWNSVNQDKEPIDMPMDFTDDVEWRLNAPTDLDEAA